MAEKIQSNNPKVEGKVQELMDKNLYLVETKIDSCESYAYDGGDKIYEIKGTAMPLDEVSRNQARYNKDRVKEIVNTMIEKPILVNHDWEMVPIGKVTNAYIDEKDNEMKYEAEIDDPIIAKKIERGYVKNVSIGGLVDYVNFETKDDIPEVYLSEFVELSFATIPGFQNASTMLAESYGKMTKEQKDQEQTHGEEQEQSTEDRVAELESKLSEMSSQHEEILNRITSVESRVDAIEEESQESSEGDDEDDDDKEDETSDDEKKHDDDDEDNKESLTRKGVPSQGSEKKSIDLREVSLNRKGY